MKQKFRKGKPPLRILEKGDVNRKPYKKKLIKVVVKPGEPLPQAILIKKNVPAVEKINFKLPHGTAVTVKVGEHAGETAVVIGPSKSVPGRLGVLTLGGIVHYKIEDLEVQK
jgi:hypothetical protein